MVMDPFQADAHAWAREPFGPADLGDRRRTRRLARVAARDGELGAFEAVDAERVLAEAAGVDARPDRFALPLAGVPVAVKDNVPVAGHPTRHGSAAASTALRVPANLSGAKTTRMLAILGHAGPG